MVVNIGRKIKKHGIVTMNAKINIFFYLMQIPMETNHTDLLIPFFHFTLIPLNYLKQIHTKLCRNRDFHKISTPAGMISTQKSEKSYNCDQLIFLFIDPETIPEPGVNKFLSRRPQVKLRARSGTQKMGVQNQSVRRIETQLKTLLFVLYYLHITCSFHYYHYINFIFIDSCFNGRLMT